MLNAEVTEADKLAGFTGVCPSLAHTQELAVGLHKREISTGQDRLCLGQGITLTCACTLADIVILEQPVAILMITFNEADGCQSLLHFGVPLLGFLHQVDLGLSLGTFLLSDRLGILDALLRRVPGELLVIALRILLFELSLLHLLLQVSNQAVHHGDDAVALFALLGVGTESLWGRRLSSLIVHAHLNEGSWHKRWVVELVQSVLGHTDDLQGCTVVGHQ